jgi:hypothetical protein
MPEVDDQRIRHRAYLLSEEAGHPEGQDDHFWHMASLELMSEDQAAEPSAELPEIILKKRA